MIADVMHHARGVSRAACERMESHSTATELAPVRRMIQLGSVGMNRRDPAESKRRGP
jgi:hypothetical protein